jgi:methionine synthase I (cobalamin-dependent)
LDKAPARRACECLPAEPAELDNALELDTGDPQELGEQYADLLARFPHINVLGGCCGTDHRHIEAISRACCAANQKAA